MSLYGGVKFSIGDRTAEEASKGSTSTATPAANGQSAASGSAKPGSSSSNPIPILDNLSAAPPTEKTKPAATGEWSAALKFAPRIPKPKAAPTGRPTALTTLPLDAASAQNGSGIASGSGSAGEATPPISSISIAKVYQPDIVRSAEPQLFGVNKQDKNEIVLGADGRPLARAPAMLLTSGKGKGKRKGKDGAQPAEGKKRKKKKKRKQYVPIMPTFDPDEQYDPFKPNDLGEYQYYRKKLREERRTALLEEKRRRAAGESSEGSSYYTGSSEDEAPRRDAPKMFAPPKQYSPPPSSARPPTPPHGSTIPLSPSRSNSGIADHGDDAYARRAALSSAAATGDDAYARRAAMSQAATGDDAYARRAAIGQAATGDDAYSRRAAMAQTVTEDDAYARRSAMPQQTPPAPSSSSAFVPPPAHLSFAAPHPPPPSSASAEFPPPPPPQLPPSDIPGFGQIGRSQVIEPPPAPANAGVPAQATSGPGSAEFSAMLEERKRAAQAIAARLQGLGGQAAPSAPPANPVMPPPVFTPASAEDTSGTFAEKMFRKWGHVEGTGLGARGEGMIHALAAEHVEAPPKPTDPSQPLTKRQIAKQKAAAANAKNKNRKWVQHATSRGKIVNANEDERSKEEKDRLGEAGRVICLVGLVNSVDEVDEELSEEIGEECSKYGIVERVVLHMVEPPPPDPTECLRIFVVFSGMAGAWRAIKEIDGRFFGGKKIRATYFDETKFDAGDRDGPVAS